MTRRIIAAVSRALTAPADRRHDHVHFHQGSHGQPAACFEPGCDRPYLHVG